MRLTQCSIRTSSPWKSASARHASRHLCIVNIGALLPSLFTTCLYAASNLVSFITKSSSAEIKNLLNFCNSALSVLRNSLCSSVSLRFSPGLTVVSPFAVVALYSGMALRHFFSVL